MSLTRFISSVYIAAANWVTSRKNADSWKSLIRTREYFVNSSRCWLRLVSQKPFSQLFADDRHTLDVLFALPMFCLTLNAGEINGEKTNWVPLLHTGEFNTANLSWPPQSTFIRLSTWYGQSAFIARHYVLSRTKTQIRFKCSKGRRVKHASSGFNYTNFQFHFSVRCFTFRLLGSALTKSHATVSTRSKIMSSRMLHRRCVFCLFKWKDREWAHH